MITGELKNKIDALWDMFAAGGLVNPLEVIEFWAGAEFSYNSSTNRASKPICWFCPSDPQIKSCNPTSFKAGTTSIWFIDAKIFWVNNEEYGYGELQRLADRAIRNRKKKIWPH